MADAPDGGAGRPRSDLPLRLASALVLMAVALGALAAGGVVFAAFAAVGAALVMVEWNGLAGPYAARAAAAGTVVLAAVSVFTAGWDPGASTASLLAVAFVVALFGAVDRRMRWLAAGILYAGLPGIAAVVLRGDAPAGEMSPGLVALVLVFAVVWGTDTGAYFAGRTLGGPKLWPRVSPKKTWSGALGGLLVAVAVSVAVAVWQKVQVPPLVAVALLLSVVSQAGDLAESAMKRHFGVKDSGRLIPGHGGVMDRVDGLAVVLAVAAVIGVARGGVAGAGDGLLVW